LKPERTIADLKTMPRYAGEEVAPSGKIVAATAGCTFEEHAERVRLAFQPVTTLDGLV
jgi:hypothetical protein